MKRAWVGNQRKAGKRSLDKQINFYIGELNVAPLLESSCCYIEIFYWKKYSTKNIMYGK